MKTVEQQASEMITEKLSRPNDEFKLTQKKKKDVTMPDYNTNTRKNFINQELSLPKIISGGIIVGIGFTLMLLLSI